MLKKPVNDSRRILIPLILSLIAFTASYQLRPFLSDVDFSYVSFPAYIILPAILVGFSSTITIKLFRKKHFQTKAFFIFTSGTAGWFIAE